MRVPGFCSGHTSIKFIAATRIVKRMDQSKEGYRPVVALWGVWKWRGWTSSFLWKKLRRRRLGGDPSGRGGEVDVCVLCKPSLSSSEFLRKAGMTFKLVTGSCAVQLAGLM